jgi:small-conductance mechanosensitive channel
LTVIETIQRWLSDELGLSQLAQEKLLATLVTLVVLTGLRYALLRLVRRADNSLKRQYYWSRISLNVIVIVMVLAAARIWFHSFESMGTILGLASAGLAIALKDPITDFVGWLFIVSRNPFELGDRIEIGEHRGDVVDRRAFQFTLMEVGGRVGGEARTGRIIHVPNATVFTTPLANYSSGWFSDLWLELPVVITFESNWKAAKAILVEIAARHGRARSDAMEAEVASQEVQYLVLPETLEPQVITRVVDHGVELSVRVLCPPQQLRATEAEIWESILSTFGGRDDVDLAYPTTRLFANDREGKPGARATVGRQA